MKTVVLQIVLFISLLTLLPIPSYAQRYAECDACGYCSGRDVPESWIDCRNCLYPSIAAHNGQATSNETLQIIIAPIPDPNNPNKVIVNVPLPPARGKYFTQLGCVDTSLSSFSDPGAVGGVLNFLLTKLIFPSTGVLAFGALIYGAFLLLTAQGAEMQIASGKRYVTGAIVGLIFTFSIVLVVNIIGGDVLRIPGLSRGTQLTLIGFGEATTEGSIVTYPNIGIYYDGKKIDEVLQIQGTATSPETHTFSLPVSLNTTDSIQIAKLTVKLENDRNIGHGNDRNYRSLSMKIDGKICVIRELSRPSPGQTLFNDLDNLPLNWPQSQASFWCKTL
ncbi:MAG: hypothetical protein Q8P72_03685 [Candidatus Roizmanbacteria bacterium]|nr:hypothetical protein [Candidatus Roizmanbacteria bacterium]